MRTSAAVAQPRAAGRPIEHGLLAGAIAALFLAVTACSDKSAGSQPPAAAAPKQESADEFIARVNRDLDALELEGNAADWIQKTYITADSELVNARANDRYLAYIGQAAAESKRFDGQPLSPATERSIKLLRLNVSAPAPRRSTAAA